MKLLTDYLIEGFYFGNVCLIQVTYIFENQGAIITGAVELPNELTQHGGGGGSSILRKVSKLLS